MSVADTFTQFMDGLKPTIRQQIAPHVTTLAQAQTMVIKVDLYTAHGGKADAGSSSSGNSGGRGGGQLAGRKGKLGVVEENPQQASEMMIAGKKKLKDLKKKSWAKAEKLEQLKKSSKKAKPRICHFCKKEGNFVKDWPEMEKLRKLSASTSLGNA